MSLSEEYLSIKASNFVIQAHPAKQNKNVHTKCS